MNIEFDVQAIGDEVVLGLGTGPRETDRIPVPMDIDNARTLGRGLLEAADQAEANAQNVDG